MPYGDKSESELARYLGENVALLEAAGVDAIVMGCNTSCAVAAKRGWPAARIPILDLIVTAADDVVRTAARKVGVLATTATAASGAYGNAIRARDGRAEVQEVAAPALVPLVEAGTLHGPVARSAVARALLPFHPGLDTLVLACTHYPLLAEHFSALLPAHVRLLDPALAQAERAAEYVNARPAAAGSGHTRYLTTGSLDAFRRALVDVFELLRPGDDVVPAPPAVAHR